MLKLKKYYKPFIFSIILAVCFLFVEAMCNLKLPDYMSSIVNVGVQSSGIQEATPKAISQKAMDTVVQFMNEEEKQYVYSKYTLVDIGNEEYLEQYPLLNTQNIYVLNNIGEEEIQKLDGIFEITSQVILNYFSQMNNDANMGNTQNSPQVIVELNKIYEVVPSVVNNLTGEALDNAIQTAKMQNELSTSQTALTFTVAYYDELGIDISKIQMSYIMQVGLKMLVISVVGICAAVIVGYLGAKVGSGLGRNLRKAVFNNVETFSNTEFDKFSIASLITRTTNDVTQIQNITIMAIRMLAFAPIMGIGALIMMLNKTTTMTFTIVLGCAAIILLIIILFKFVLPKFKIIQQLTDKLNLVSKENLTGIMVIKAFGTQKHEEKRFDEVNKELTSVNLYVVRAMSLMMPCMMLIMNMLCVLILWVGSNEIAASQMQVGDMMAVMQYAMEVIMSFLMVSIIFVMLPRASVSAQRINEVLETKTSIENNGKNEEFKKDKIGYVEFKNVTFNYAGADETVLDNVSFIAKPGQTTAFIGSTGSGKSTLINLVPRFFDATGGEVLVNGVNVKNIELEKLREQIGYIPQKGNLLSGTIMSNLKYGNENANEEYISECTKVAQAYEFIQSTEKGYDSEISQGAKNVSGGQKQRISIARALIKNAPIYIFDDSFSALDFKTDANLRKALKQYAKDSTILIVAQRVNTIMNADQIVVLDKGKVVGIGTHEQLLKNCSQYYEIASSQLSKEELENGTQC